MSDAAWIAFLIVTVLAFGFFFFKKRCFDFLTIAYIGAIFYFSPLFWGRVLQPSPDLDSTIQPAVYLIATAYVLALVLAATAIAAFPRHRAPMKQTRRRLSEWYLVLAGFGLLGALIASKGAIIDAEKLQVLKQVGYLYVLFEIAASLACISAVIERRWWIATGSVVLLAIDLLVGFRVFVVLTALSVALVLLMRQGRVRLFTKAPNYGLAALLLVVAMLLAHTARFALFESLASLQSIPGLDTAQMRGDILQYDKAQAPQPHSTTGPPLSTSANEVTSKVPKWVQIPFDLLQRSEPSIIQATLVAVVQRDLSCSPSNIFKSLFLLAPPGFTKLVPNPFPPTFFDEYQPILYPDLTSGGLAGNIWAEMLCRFGYVGVAIFGILTILTLLGAYDLLRKYPTAAAPIALGGVVVAFYMNRNDLQYTLVMLRQIAIVFALAYGLSTIAARVLRARRPDHDSAI
jgi:hypothetical protein